MSRFRPPCPSPCYLLLPTFLMPPAQAAATDGVALQGTATDAAGHPLSGVIVRMISDAATHSGHPWRYTLIGDALGEFSRQGLAPGAYLVMRFPGGQASTRIG